MQYILFVGIIIAIIIIAKLLSWPFKLIFKLVANILIGLVLILLVNIFGSPIGLHIPFNTITALVAGILGIPGVILLVIFNYII
ncbi:MAG: pro-sigmaK processing inhibitor BofA family protein [Clostridia bacterium]|nr:pro-sigmaK processing inhibitor BofA family protein [Clostridia bacterium]